MPPLRTTRFDSERDRVSIDNVATTEVVTAFGTMHSSYVMERQGGEQFDAEIAAFSLSTPYAVN